MCGIVGFANSDCDERAVIEKMLSVVHRRGPDENNWLTIEKYKLWMGHARLRIRGSNAGRQPNISISGRYVITFNGELYNIKEISEKFQLKYSHSDTKILSDLIDNVGVVEALQSIEGMFAIVVYDTLLDTLHLARDMAGEKPLYYYTTKEKNLIYGSTVSAISAHPKFQKYINQQSLGHFFIYKHTKPGGSIYKNLNEVMPGTVVTCHFRQEFCVTVQYFALPKMSSLANSRMDLPTLIKNEIESMLISDVQLGCFLSGGVDSSLVSAIAQSKLDTPLNTFSIGFQNKSLDESAYAQNISKLLGTKHVSCTLGAKELNWALENYTEAYDEPFSDTSAIPTMVVCKLAKDHGVTVCLTGDGGDEVFGGYKRYNIASKIRRLSNILPYSIKDYSLNHLLFLACLFPVWKSSEMVSLLTKAKKSSVDVDFYDAFLRSELGSQQHRTLNESVFAENKSYTEMAQLNTKNAHMLYDFTSYLPNTIFRKVERASMLVSLETRAPFVSKRLTQFVFSSDLEANRTGDWSKSVLRDMLSEYIPLSALVAGKRGFGSPIDDWLKGLLIEQVYETIEFSKEILDELFKTKNYSATIYKSYLEGNHSAKQHVWDLFMFSKWYKHNA